ncbi:hypothetical protein IscW_ISCW007429 [Ixodes scapularis]|uniref:Uncharacterized protein n=1 Tax=Ixodes scapularis TaxID=6945 RepID=B7PRQ6_IXOSC|nr:hypothetical protein IscW_ISCW007429 [Ixodes scapularis]|eukprot:XP_002400778.1 hypothetical protein IscW_ISCW007429 [Ixodes scapularis]
MTSSSLLLEWAWVTDEVHLKRMLPRATWSGRTSKCSVTDVLCSPFSCRVVPARVSYFGGT